MFKLSNRTLAARLPVRTPLPFLVIDGQRLGEVASINVRGLWCGLARTGLRADASRVEWAADLCKENKLGKSKTLVPPRFSCPDVVLSFVLIAGCLCALV